MDCEQERILTICIDSLRRHLPDDLIVAKVPHHGMCALGPANKIVTHTRTLNQRTHAEDPKWTELRTSTPLADNTMF